jgi:hypothetical protein
MVIPVPWLFGKPNQFRPEPKNNLIDKDNDSGKGRQTPPSPKHFAIAIVGTAK